MIENIILQIYLLLLRNYKVKFNFFSHASSIINFSDSWQIIPETSFNMQTCSAYKMHEKRIKIKRLRKRRRSVDN